LVLSPFKPTLRNLVIGSDPLKAISVRPIGIGCTTVFVDLILGPAKNKKDLDFRMLFFNPQMLHAILWSKSSLDFNKPFVVNLKVWFIDPILGRLDKPDIIFFVGTPRT
jgi:hypothetical protein